MKIENTGDDACQEKESADNVRKGIGELLEKGVPARFGHVDAKRVRQCSANGLFGKCQISQKPAVRGGAQGFRTGPKTLPML